MFIINRCCFFLALLSIVTQLSKYRKDYIVQRYSSHKLHDGKNRHEMLICVLVIAEE